MDNPRFAIFGQFVRFNLVGLINAGLTYLIYSLIVFLGLHYYLALGIEYTFGITFSFVANRKFTFTNATSRGLTAFRRIVGVYLTVLVANFLLLTLLIEVLEWNEYLAQAAALAFLAPFSYVFQKKHVFKEPGHRASTDGGLI